MRLVLIVRSLQTGGTERQVVELARALHERGHHVTVLTFYAGGPLEDALKAAGIGAVCLHKRARWDAIGFLWRMIRKLRQLEPQIVYSFLAVPNLMSVTSQPFVPGCKWVWGVRAAMLDLSPYDRLTRWTYALEARLASRADLIICNSHAGMEHAAARGFPRDKLTVVYNGIDTQRFRPDAQAREQLRDEWSVPDQAVLVGIVARLDPVKDHSTFLQVAARMQKEFPAARFVAVGSGPAAYVDELRQQADRLGLGERLIWAGDRQDMPAVYNALDVLVLTSTAEGFPNVLAEAMACGVPCVCTNAGDSSEIVEERKWCVPTGDVAAIGAALLARIAQLPGLDRQILRQRMQQKFSIEGLLRDTEQALMRVKDGK